MSIELLMNITPSETRVAYIEDGVLQEIHVDRESKRGIVGNIYLGKIIRILPGMQAAFVDIGLEKAAFLHASDIVPLRKDATEGNPLTSKVKDISELIRLGQDILVQVIKDPLGTKGARLTTDITLPSRYLVFMPRSSHAGISQRIENEEERQRLKGIISNFCDDHGGFIVRTVAEGAPHKALEQDAQFLKRLWNKIQDRSANTDNGRIVYGELMLAQRVLRDFVGDPIDRILLDSKLTYDSLKDFTQEFIPEVTGKLELYRGRLPIFDMYDTEKEIQRSLDRKVKLKSGGYLIIDQTEAMTTIDINTGAFVGHRNLEETLFNTNIEATIAIARQLRLRNLGGIIIIDFIDMKSDIHKEKVLNSLQQALQHDRVKTTVNYFSPLGLVEMTRKRTRESLEHLICEECPSCTGRGRVKSVETVCFEILRELVRIDKSHQLKYFRLYVSTSVANALKHEHAHALAELEIFVGKPVEVIVQPVYTQEQFDVILM